MPFVADGGAGLSFGCATTWAVNETKTTMHIVMEKSFKRFMMQKYLIIFT